MKISKLHVLKLNQTRRTFLSADYANFYRIQYISIAGNGESSPNSNRQENNNDKIAAM